jgi:hypothetical protein
MYLKNPQISDNQTDNVEQWFDKMVSKKDTTKLYLM